MRSASESSSLRVLLLDDAIFEDRPGGSRLVVRELARGLVRRGHEVTTLTPRHEETPSDLPDDIQTSDRGRVVRYPKPVSGGARAFPDAGRDACARLLAATPGFDVAHTHFAWAGLGPLRALPETTARIRTFHGPWDEECWLEESAGAGALGRFKAGVKRRMRRGIEQTSLRTSVRVTTMSEHFRHLAANRYNMDPMQITAIPGGVDVARFSPAPGGRTTARERLGLPLQKRILLSVRRLVPRMGLEDLIAALPDVVRRFPDTLLLIGGEGPHRPALESGIVQAGMQAHIRLLGFVPDAQLADYYRAADLFVLPTVALEGFGLVTAEALASGTPVVGTPVGATPEILKDLEPRLLTAGTGPQALAEALLGLLRAGEEAGSWAQDLTPERLHTYVCGRYTWDRHVQAMEHLYRAAAVAQAHREKRQQR